MDAVGLICARGGSRGLPGKNLRRLGGETLVGLAVRHLMQTESIRRVLISTDSEEIAAAARDAGAESPFMRPTELAQDHSPEWEVWRHALRFLSSSEGRLPDALVVAPATSPLRIPQDIQRALSKFGNGTADLVLAMTPAHRSPYFNMVVAKADGAVGLVNPPISQISRRQDAPAVFDITTVVYVARPGYVLNSPGLFSGRVEAIEVPAERAIDIDTPLDFAIANCLFNWQGTTE